MCSCESLRGDRRCLKEEFLPLFVLFVLFGQAKRTLKDKYHKVTFFIVLFSDEKYQKSARRTHAVLLPNHRRRARVSRASHAWQVHAAKRQRESRRFCRLHGFILPRVRTYHTKKPSRFVHALSARPLKNGWRGRESNMCADGIEHIFFAFSVGYAWTLSCRGRRLDDPHDTTGSKRPRADSDSLLCHVGLRRTSRSMFGCYNWEACALTWHGDMLCFSLIPIPYPPQSTNSFAYTNTTKGHK